MTGIIKTRSRALGKGHNSQGTRFLKRNQDKSLTEEKRDREEALGQQGGISVQPYCCFCEKIKIINRFSRAVGSPDSSE